ncbi:unnamed protein product [Protopolystoma xenopodis]|uniref:Uncharacterized protein n=1 Tax=Protopolystoma xenopodis TaxID=117903 RepID=A0A3S5C7M8_9PLAT|nr:unnamed protein product [Protopolystoma xenopodis]
MLSCIGGSAREGSRRVGVWFYRSVQGEEVGRQLWSGRSRAEGRRKGSAGGWSSFRRGDWSGSLAAPSGAERDSPTGSPPCPRQEANAYTHGQTHRLWAGYASECESVCSRPRERLVRSAPAQKHSTTTAAGSASTPTRLPRPRRSYGESVDLGQSTNAPVWARLWLRLRLCGSVQRVGLFASGRRIDESAGEAASGNDRREGDSRRPEIGAFISRTANYRHQPTLPRSFTHSLSHTGTNTKNRHTHTHTYTQAHHAYIQADKVRMTSEHSEAGRLDHQFGHTLTLSA